MRKLFLPSMIEVEFNDFYRECARRLITSGFNTFHIDFGDQGFIRRRLQPWDKVSFLKSLSSKVRLTAHIMSKSGTHSGSVETITKKCIKENFEVIYIHSRSFETTEKLIAFKNFFFQGVEPQFGLVSEVEHTIDDRIIDFINKNSVKKLLQMGVPIGMGGQKFSWSAIQKIKNFRQHCPNLNIIEIDGGLTFEVIDRLTKIDINRFSGWSLVNDKDPIETTKKALKLKDLLQ